MLPRDPQQNSTRTKPAGALRELRPNILWPRGQELSGQKGLRSAHGERPKYPESPPGDQGDAEVFRQGSRDCGMSLLDSPVCVG